MSTVTRKDAAKQLGVSREKLARLERDGVAKPELNDRKVPTYSSEEVERLRETIPTVTPAPSAKSRGTSASRTTVGNVPASEETQEMLDLAQRLEASIRVADAEKRLATIRGEEEARTAELQLLRAQQAQLAENAAAERRRHSWRRQRVQDLVARTVAELTPLVPDPAMLLRAAVASHAVLSSLSDSVLAGDLYPRWVAADVFTAMSQVPPLVPPCVLVASGWRPIGPGD